MLDALASFDQYILLAINSYHCEFLDPIISLLSRNRLIWLPVYLLITFGMIKTMGWKIGLLFVVGCIIAIGLSDFTCASIIRPWVQRLRPSNPDNPVSDLVHIVNGYRSSRYTFPSCHAANSFAIATFVAVTMRRRWITISIFCWAIFLSYTRLYLGVHYPGDLLVGASVGSAIAYGVYIAVRYARQRWMKNAITVAILIAMPSAMMSATETAETDKPRLAWDVDFRSVFDNRECDAIYTPAQTYFLAQLAPEIGVKFLGNRHLVSGGVVYTQPIGCEWDGRRISPTLYYLYNNNKTRFAFGMIPRRHLLRELPNYIESDSANYFQNNIRGAMVAMQYTDGFFQALVDWRGMQGIDRREAFHIIGQGEWHRKDNLFLAGGLAMLNHLAKRKNAPSTEFVVDNIIANPYVGLDLTPIVSPLDSLSLRVGPITSLTRNRADNKWIAPVGLWGDINIGWWRLSLKNTIYIGNKPLFPLHSLFGSLLNEGEPFYASKFYNRTTLKGCLFSYKEMVSLDAALDFHVAQHNFTFYQRLILRVTI